MIEEMVQQASRRRNDKKVVAAAFFVMADEGRGSLKREPNRSSAGGDQTSQIPRNATTTRMTESKSSGNFDPRHQKKHDKDDDDDDDSAVVAFASVDFSGVDFDEDSGGGELSKSDRRALALERGVAFGDFSALQSEGSDAVDSGDELSDDLRYIGECLASGNYARALQHSEFARTFFDASNPLQVSADETASETVVSWIRQRIFDKCHSVSDCVAAELTGVAAYNLFLQANYTGPAVSPENDDSALTDINPHPCFKEFLNSQRDKETKKDQEGGSNVGSTSKVTEPKRDVKYQNAVLSELAVDGEWPCQVCIAPYFLLVARSLFLALANPYSPHRAPQEEPLAPPPPAPFAGYLTHLHGSQLWCARSAVTNERLLQSRQPTVMLWKEVDLMFGKAIEYFCPAPAKATSKGHKKDKCAAVVMLEWGLALHHFDRPGKGKDAFVEAQKYSGLAVKVTGAEGKRTKFQRKATAQMLVKATSASSSSKPTEASIDKSSPGDTQKKVDGGKEDFVRGQMIEHGEDGVLLERIKFEDDKENEVAELNVLDQAILLSFCLDVKNNNPADGLTAEEMGAYLARVLDHHDDWMVYSTALLERAWLEFERSHARERAILQMQALADQHTERLTITQSTRESIEDSAPVQDRLKMLHCIVYPPRWAMIQDLADRYSGLGIVTSAAELYTEVELWDDVVDCYRRAEKLPLAEKIVRERLAVQETPRMWSALGDLTNDPEHYKRAIDLSRGRFSDAYVALGAHYFQKGDLPTAAEYYECALKVRPLSPYTWFRLGTISMQLGRWDKALRAFSEVVQQEPEEAEAWANVAAIHMRNKHPAEAYPALVESLRYNRNNWRIWVSKLYACLDLKKYDEAVQACNTLLDLRAQRQAAEGIPALEEKCVRAIVGGAVKGFHDSRGDAAASESSRRTLTRVSMLLHRIKSSSDSEPWVYETLAFFHDQVGQDEKVLEDLSQEYRSLSQIQGWEKDDNLLRKICGVVSHMVGIYAGPDGGSNRESLAKAKFLARGVVKRIRTARADDPRIPNEVGQLEASLEDIEKKLQSLDETA